MLELNNITQPDLILWAPLLVLLVVVIILLVRIAGQLARMELRRDEQANTQAFSMTQVQQSMLQAVQHAREAQMQAVADLQARLEQRFGDMQQSMEKRLGETSQASIDRMAKSSDVMHQALQAQLKSLQLLKSDFEQRFGDMQQGIEKRLGEMSKSSIESFSRSNEQLQEVLQKRLLEMSGIVEQRLDKGFEKTTETFTDVVKRLALIDEAQKRITELSGSVVSLQEVLTDKRSRGAFGEVQMAGLIRNIMPEDSFKLQHTLSNGTRVDCMMFLPEPTGNVAIDSKFPLDAYQKMMDEEASDSDRAAAQRQFRLDIKKHIRDIAGKYIIADETADGAIMFIPAEAVFAEIHAHQPQLVEEAQRARVWMVSPTTLMAVLTTARAVLKDSATRKQVHVIQEHLVNLGKDFQRFRKRMDNLAKHIQQANKDVEEVHISAGKISGRFDKIEKVEIPQEDEVALIEKEEA
ncbi:MAG TPA: DNA recombination protein RmuC [Thiotrichales bacterium]|nr:DNA recombination protein RmuC [Thiotrichales bacterium]